MRILKKAKYILVLFIMLLLILPYPKDSEAKGKSFSLNQKNYSALKKYRYKRKKIIKKKAKKISKRNSKKTKTKKSVIKPKNINIYVTTSTIKVGETRRIKVAKSKASIKVRFVPENTKDKNIRVSSSDSSILSVRKIDNRNYDYTGNNSGYATLIIKTNAKKANCSNIIKKIRMRVIAGTKIGNLSVEQLELDKISIGYDNGMPDLSTLKITDENNNSIPITNTEQKNGKIIASLGTQLASSKPYHIEAKGYSSYFVSADTKASDILLKNQNIKFRENVKLDLRLVNSSGMDVTNAINNASLQPMVKLLSQSDYSTTLSGSGLNTSIYLYSVGSRATINVSWAGVEKSFDLLAVDNKNQDLSTVYKYTLVSNNIYPTWDNIGEGQIPTMQKSDKGVQLALLLKLDNNRFISNLSYDSHFIPDAIFKYEVGKGSIIKIDDNGVISPKKNGRAYIKVTMLLNNNKYIYNLPILVDDLKIGNIQLSPNNVTLSNRGEEKTVAITVRNSKGLPLYLSNNTYKYHNLTLSSPNSNDTNYTNNKDIIATLCSFNKENNGLVITTSLGNKIPAGRYVYKVDYGIDNKNYSTAFLTVNVQDSTNDNTGRSYSLGGIEALNGTLDTTINSNTTMEQITKLSQPISLAVVPKNQFGTTLKDSYGYDYTINNKPIDSSMPFITSTSSGALAIQPITVEGDGPNNSKVIRRYFNPGFYHVECKYNIPGQNGYTVLSANFQVIDNTEKPVLGKDFLVKENGNIQLTQTMNGKISDIVNQVVTTPTGATFTPNIIVPRDQLVNNNGTYIDYLNNQYHNINMLIIPKQIITAGGSSVYVYELTPVNITLIPIR